MSKKRPSPQEANSLQLIGAIENLIELRENLGLSASSTQLRPSSSHSSISSNLTSVKSNNDLRDISEDDVASTEESEPQQKIWTKSLFIDISSNGKFLVLVSQKEIAVLTSKWKQDKLSFTKEWYGQLTDTSTGGEVLTCCLALPLRSQHKSSDGLPDWTCIVYGFQSGYVGFHTEQGYVVHRQLFDYQSVKRIKLRSAPCDDGQDQQELVILYEMGVVVIINGMDLYASLQCFKQQAATAVSKGSIDDDVVLSQSIPHEKFHCDSRQHVHDVISLGVSRITAFDQLQTASVLSGKSAVIKGHLPTFRRFIAAGSSPLCASYFVMEGENSLVLTEVARAVASKVTSAVTSRISATANRFGLSYFLPRAGAAGAEVEKRQRTLPKTSTNVQPRYSIFDARRVATSIVLSGSNRMAAMTDNFGRVLLLDCASGLVVRMWKGYRSSDVAWMTLLDNRSNEQPKKSVECLIIYAPRRHLLEVWTALSGRRLVATRVSQGLRLLPLSADIVGHGPASDDGSFASSHSQCYFLDLSGNLFTLNIPFYLVEEGGDNENGQDAQALQELKEFIMTGRSSGGKAKTVGEFVASITSYEVKDHAVDFLLSHESAKILPTTIAAVLEKEIESLSVFPVDEVTEPMRLTKRAWTEKLILINWLKTLKTNHDTPAGLVEDDDAQTLLNYALDDLDAVTLFLLIDSVTAAQNSLNPSSPDLNIPLGVFLNFFDRIPESGEEEVVFQLDEAVAPIQRVQFGLLVFAPFFQRKITFQQLKWSLERLQRRNLMHLLLLVWLEQNEELGGCSNDSLIRLERILHVLLADLSPEEIREYRPLLEESVHIPAALTAGLAILSAGFRRDVSGASDEWETICKEKLEWTRLCHRLESLLSLQNFLVRFMLPGKSLVDSVLPLSVTDFLQKGNSAPAEYLAAWCARGFLEISPSIIMKAFYSSDVEIKLPSSESEDHDDRPLRFLQVADISLDKKEISEALTVLRAVFPRSLTADCVLSNCGLEFAVNWSRNPEEIDLLALSLAYLKDVINSRITHGIALVIWKTFLLERLSACATLMEKVGKAPKERLFSKEVGLPESAIVTFLDLTHTFLSLIADAEYNRMERFSLETEDLWYNDVASMKSSAVEMAVSQAATTAPLVRHHMILVTVLHAVMFYSLKSVKPLSLFDFKAREAFFQDLTLHPVLSVVDLDQAVIRSRNQFLSRVVAALVRVAAEHCQPPDVVWMERILEVASYWEIAGDEVRTLYVVELYSNGLDELGAEAYKTVTDKQPMVARLMLLAGQRLVSLASSAKTQTTYAKNFSTMSPTLGSWVRSMDATALANENVDWEQCYLLVRNISHDMSRNQAQYKICTEVLEWIQHYILAR